MVLGKLVIYMQNTDPNLTPWTKINSRWIKVLNIRLETLNVLQQKIGKTLESIYFLNRTQITQEIRVRIGLHK
jgi:hypothetical protein